MGQVFTEDLNLSSAPEPALGVVPSTAWRQHQPNTIGRFGNSVKKIARDIISASRQRERGRAVDADSAVEMEFDLTKDALDRDIEDVFKAIEKFSGGTGIGRFFPTAVTATGYTVPAGGALLNNALVYARGFTTAANNGLKQLAGTSTATEVKTAGLVAEASPPANATLEVAGWRGAAADIGMNASGNLTSTALNFTTQGFIVGQWIWVGGTTVGTTFANTTYRGWARIAGIAAGVLTLDRRSWTVGAADAGTGKTIDIYYGSFVRNVSSLHADYRRPSKTYELTLPNLGAGGVPEYIYARGSMMNSYALTLSPGDKITVQASAIGTISDEPTTVQATGASVAMVPTPGTIGMITTSSDLARLRLSNVDETGISTDFRDMTITFNNNVKRENQLGVFGAAKMIVGGFDVMVDTTIILASDEVIRGIRDNRKASMDLAMRNDDGASLLDLPSVQLDDMPLDTARNESVRVKGKISAVRDEVLSTTASLSRLPYCPEL